MASPAEIYNSLPSVEEADNKFTDRERIFSMLVPILRGYEDKFGVGLVHGHAKLREGEKMVTSGLITRPRSDVEGYPERWLATGQPYVFNVQETECPSDDLSSRLKEVFSIAGDIDGIDILGVAYLGNLPLPSDEVYMETTHGRVDTLALVPRGLDGTIWTCWRSVNGAMCPVITCQKGENGEHVRILAPFSRDGVTPAEEP